MGELALKKKKIPGSPIVIYETGTAAIQNAVGYSYTNDFFNGLGGSINSDSLVVYSSNPSMWNVFTITVDASKHSKLHITAKRTGGSYAQEFKVGYVPTANANNGNAFIYKYVTSEYAEYVFDISGLNENINVLLRVGYERIESTSIWLEP